jgi:hypothetical protein
MSGTILKFIKDKSVASSPFDLIQWDASGDIAYVPNVSGDWVIPPTGALEALDELAQRVTDLPSPTGVSLETKAASFSTVDGKVYIVTAIATATLPAPALNTQITIKKFGAADVTVAQNGSENIEGVAASFVMSSVKQSATFISDGTDWFII